MSENGTETAAQETNVTNADATIDETVQTAEQSTQDITAQVAGNVVKQAC